MDISYVTRHGLQDKLTNQPANSLEFIILVTGALDVNARQSWFSYLVECIRVLKEGGILFVQGLPAILPELGVFLEKSLTFKYWIAIESVLIETAQLPSAHAAVLLFTKGNGRFNIKHTRLPHQYCAACKRTLKDWGGKAHLMNSNGYVISDVIKDIPPANNYNQMSKPLFDILIQMLDFHPQKNQADTLIETPIPEIAGIVAPEEGLAWREGAVLAEPAVQYVLPDFSRPPAEQKESCYQPTPAPIIGDDLFDVVHQGDAIEILKQYPDESVDLVFADPPYNLAKDYIVYGDDRAEHQYIEWCNGWLNEYIRILKPTGALLVLNLPRWGMHHAAFLNQHLYFQNWIVWDALSEPRGKMMPAHYALLFYTKHHSNFTFNYDAVNPIDDRHYCLRASCIRKRKRIGDDDQVNLNDIWWDIHRIKHRRNRDYHPCQLPDSLMERIIKLTTNPGDVVLDALAGAGTTPIVALQLGRRYVAIDLDPYYVQMMKDKLSQIKSIGYIPRQSVNQPLRTVTKKALQLELRKLATRLGRLPTPEDVQKESQYNLQVFLETFPTWGKALKAAKLEMQN
jgi:site-specific DNA-methyltransferase (adenine-specific)